MTADAWEPIDFLAEFRERETCLRVVTELLKEKAQCETGKLWAHHLPRIVDELDFFQGLLQDEIDHFGEWRYHEFQPDEVLNFLQHVFTILKQHGRAAIVVPDNDSPLPSCSPFGLGENSMNPNFFGVSFFVCPRLSDWLACDIFSLSPV